MKLTQRQLRSLIQETLSEAPMIADDSPWREVEKHARNSVIALVDLSAKLSRLVGTHPNAKSLLRDVESSLAKMDSLQRVAAATGR